MRRPCAAIETALAVWASKYGFETADFAVVAEQDILGDRLVRRRGASAAPLITFTEAASLSQGDLIVHVDHGIGQVHRAQNHRCAGAPHDCVEIHYAGGDKLFLPVENIELLSRYGSEDTEAVLDRLGGGGGRARKARMKERIREMAGKLMQIAAARAMKQADRFVPPDGLYDEFRAALLLMKRRISRAQLMPCLMILARANRWTA